MIYQVGTVIIKPMALLSPSDQDKLRESFAEMTAPVRLLFFTQALDCGKASLQTRQILDELPALSDKITIDEVNFVLEKDGPRRTASTACPDVLLDETTRFENSLVGTPSATSHLARARRPARRRPRVEPHGREPRADRRRRPAGDDAGVHDADMTALPAGVSLAHGMAFASKNITAIAVEATEFPDLRDATGDGVRDGRQRGDRDPRRFAAGCVQCSRRSPRSTWSANARFR